MVRAYLRRLRAYWRSLASQTRVRVVLLTLAATSLALRDVLLLASSAALLALNEAAVLARPRVPTAAL